MDTTSAKPGLFTFAQRPPPQGTGPWEKNANLLRLTGWLVVAGAVLTILGIWQARARSGAPWVA